MSGCCAGASPRPATTATRTGARRTTTSTTTTRRDEPAAAPRKTVVTVAAAVVATEPEYLDVDIVDEDSGALPDRRLGVGDGRRPESELPLGFDREHSRVLSRQNLRRGRRAAEVKRADDHEEDAVDEPMTDEFAAASEDDTDYDYEYVDESHRGSTRRPTPTCTWRGRSRRSDGAPTSRRPRRP